MIKRIDTDAISALPEARLRFLEEFAGFTHDDWNAIQSSTEVVVPRLPELLDAVYAHLISFDDTRRLFSAKDGTENGTENGTEDGVDALYVAVRKQHLVGWLRATVGASPETRADFANYLNVIGRRHTSIAGDASRVVAPRYIVGLTAFLQAEITAIIQTAISDDQERAVRMISAWNKMLMIQLEMFLKNVAPQWPSWDERREDEDVEVALGL